jgi:hypothetical protein
MSPEPFATERPSTPPLPAAYYWAFFGGRPPNSTVRAERAQGGPKSKTLSAHSDRIWGVRQHAQRPTGATNMHNAPRAQPTCTTPHVGCNRGAATNMHNQAPQNKAPQRSILGNMLGNMVHVLPYGWKHGWKHGTDFRVSKNMVGNMVGNMVLFSRVWKHGWKHGACFALWLETWLETWY